MLILIFVYILALGHVDIGAVTTNLKLGSVETPTRIPELSRIAAEFHPSLRRHLNTPRQRTKTRSSS
jgi:hypothetical protein